MILPKKIGIVLGMFSFGLLETPQHGSMRNSVGLLSIYFIIAFVILMFALVRKRLKV